MKPFFILLLTILVTIPAITLAQDNYLVGIPGVTQGESTNFDQYIQAVYVMFISIAALLAVVKIIIAGVKYMFTDIVTQKGEAKKDIQGAVFGLLIVLSAVLILTVINPELTRFNPNINGVGLPPEQLQENGGNNTFFTEEPIYPDSVSADEFARYISACLSQTGNYGVETVVNSDGTRISECVNYGGVVGISTTITNDSDRERLANRCYQNEQILVTNPLPNGLEQGSCVSCTGGEEFNSTNNRCESIEVVCDDGGDIASCNDVNFTSDGTFTLSPGVTLGSREGITFSCDYPDISVYTSCSNFCYGNGGGLFQNTYCVIPPNGINPISGPR